MIVGEFCKWVTILLFFWALFQLLLSIIGKKYICNIIIKINIICIIYLRSICFWIPFILNLQNDWAGLFAVMASAIEILYIISIVICFIKTRKLKVEAKSNKKMDKIMIVICLIPLMIFLGLFFREKYLINNSELIVEYYSAGNRGFGDGKYITFAISDKFSEQISIGEKFMKKALCESTDKRAIKDTGYRLTMDGTEFIVYKNEQCIHKKKLKQSYFNNEIETLYIKNK